MKRIPFLDLRAINESLEPAIIEALARVSASGQYIGGSEVADFEERFATYCGVKHCIGVSNGLDALKLILQALNIGEGDEVIVPGHTFIATWLSVTAVGAIPVPVEPDPVSMNIDPHRIEEAIGSATRAIIPVHLYGLPADMGAINEIGERHGLTVIEDAAQAHGATIGDQATGSLGLAGAFSFYPAKNLGALGDGGAVTTNDDCLAERVRLLGNYGSSRKYHHEMKGHNCRLDPIQAAVLSLKLEYLDSWNQRRRSIAKIYRETLQSLDDVVKLPASSDESAWHLYVIRVQNRDRLLDLLEDHGIQTQVHYPTPPHRQPAFCTDPDGPDSLPITSEIASSALSLPMGPHLDERHAHYSAETVRDVLRAEH